MNKVCLKCGFVNTAYQESELGQCPKCDAYYAKVKAAIDREKNAEANALIAEQERIDQQKGHELEQIKLSKKQKLKRQSICTQCLTIGKPVTVTRGSLLTEIVLWLCFLLPGFIYSMWRHTSRYKACPSCKQQTMIKTTSPRGQQLLNPEQ